MGTLTRFLQDAFAAKCPKGWSCEAEVPLVDKSAVRRLGFEPRADILLTDEASKRRVWVEFEISRADPVANHAKFATAAMLEGLRSDDCFVSMTSRHIVPGRAALAAGTTIWMRGLGIPAFQVDLLPSLDEHSIKALNAQKLTLKEDMQRVPIREEIDRVLDASSAAQVASGHRIHKADNVYSVALNVRQWNAEVRNEAGSMLWGQRRVRFFVFDPASGLFAPSKFCAFIPGPALMDLIGSASSTVTRLGMTMDVYAQLGEQDPRFDGHIARRHLERRLGYSLLPILLAEQALKDRFSSWREEVHQWIMANADSILLVPNR